MHAHSAVPESPRLRAGGAAASGAAALIYLLIGLGIASIGTARSGEAPDLPQFGVTMAVVSLAIAAVLLRLRSRVVLGAVAALQFAVIVGYFALAEIREPPVELWGLVIKGLQLVALGVTVALVIRGRSRPS